MRDGVCVQCDLVAQTLREACTTHAELRNCTCTISFVRLMDDGVSLQPLYAINCSRLHLDHLPSFVPVNTTIFHATDNKVGAVRAGHVRSDEC